MIRALILAVLMLAALKDPARADESITCNKTAIYDTNSNGSTKLISGGSVSTVYVCGFDMMSGGTVTAKLEYGTKTTNECDTGETALTPAFSMVAQSVVTDSSAFWRGITVPPGKDVCIKTSAGVAVQLIVYYSQR